MLNIASSVIPAGRGDSVIVSAHAITGQLSFIVLVEYYCPIFNPAGVYIFLLAATSTQPLRADT